ncbi:MAG: hypothetical protein ACI3UZ_08235 [Oscillospiraceae bacterium]
MWLAEKAAETGESPGVCRVATVTKGGLNPVVTTEGEASAARLVSGGAIYVPMAGDEVVTATDEDGVCFVLGRIGGLPVEAGRGEVLICCGGSTIKIKADGTILLNGVVKIDGELFINGEKYSSSASSEGGIFVGA